MYSHSAPSKNPLKKSCLTAQLNSNVILFMKPRVFIASSVEGIGVAYAIQECLEYDFETTVWQQGVFELSQTTIETLDQQSSRFDAAVFVFSPDDEAIMRGVQKPLVRDNVIFELGLFIGRLGRDKCFIVEPRVFGTTRIPTDLLGVTAGTYDGNRTDANLVAAVGPCCNKIRRALVPPKSVPALTSVPVDDIESILLRQSFRLFFNPPKFSKRVIFSPKGIISEGNNKNEHMWRVVGDKLELVQLDGKVHSRFYYDKSDGIFKHTNDTDTLSIRGQFIAPDGQPPWV
jgi:predicted nucleotide-binding protein